MARPRKGHGMTTRNAGWLFFIPALLITCLPAAAGQNGGSVRVEQDDPSIVYSGNWYANGSSSHSDGHASLTNTRGSRATITFTGTGITWLGVKDGWAGLANVYFDGRMQVVDSYGSGGYQQALFSVRGLPAGAHTLSIEVTHERNSRTEGSWVWIDAFVIENGEPVPGGVAATSGRVEETHAALEFSGRWFSNVSQVHSAATAALAMDAGARVSVAFHGTGIRWVAYRDEWAGIARIYIDGVPKGMIDTYLAPARAQTMPFSILDLPPGPHILTIEVTGTRHESSKGSWIWLDSFDIVQ